MKQWQRKIKLKPQAPFRMAGLFPFPRNAKERREAKPSESIYRKKGYWPDRPIPLTDEEKEYEAKCTLTLGKMLDYLDKIHAGE